MDMTSTSLMLVRACPVSFHRQSSIGSSTCSIVTTASLSAASTQQHLTHSSSMQVAYGSSWSVASDSFAIDNSYSHRRSRLGGAHHLDPYSEMDETGSRNEQLLTQSSTFSHLNEVEDRTRSSPTLGRRSQDSRDDDSVELPQTEVLSEIGRVPTDSSIATSSTVYSNCLQFRTFSDCSESVSSSQVTVKTKVPFADRNALKTFMPSEVSKELLFMQSLDAVDAYNSNCFFDTIEEEEKDNGLIPIGTTPYSGLRGQKSTEPNGVREESPSRNATESFVNVCNKEDVSIPVFDLHPPSPHMGTSNCRKERRWYRRIPWCMCMIGQESSKLPNTKNIGSDS